MNYYNEFDAGAAAWLRELIKGGHIANGVVDERSIADVQPDELREYTQCHFFAGIGGWSYALRLAGWPDDRPVWTGSCPCQPFSCAGKQLGTADKRHLWPEFRRLIVECCPAIVFGEQVASAAGREWLAGVRNDLEALAYAVGGADLCAAGAGAPHIRQRLYWVADSVPTGRSEGWTIAGDGQTPRSSEAGGMGDSYRAGLQGRGGFVGQCFPSGRDSAKRHGAPAGFWGDYGLAHCTDGKTRRIPVEPAFFPLAHGIPARVVRLRGYGNAIVPPLAAEFVGAFLGIGGGSPVVSDELL